jgi:spermidine synthase
MREILNITGGYELITGSFLGSWLIGSAIGASIAGKSTLNDIKKINLIFALSPLISLLLLLFLSRVFLNPGESPSFMVAIIGTLIILIPFCLVSGFTFIKLLGIAGKGNNILAGKSFSIETAGGIVAGIILSIFTAGLVNTYKLLLLIVLMSITYVLIIYYLAGKKHRIIAKTVVFLLASLIILSNPDIFFRQILLPGVKVTMTKDTPYGNITKGKYKGEESLYYNQRLLAYNDDATEREEDIHYAMLQSESPEKVIMISGSLPSHLPEILKYPVNRIIYIERDPALARIESTAISNLPGSTFIVNNDAYEYIRDSKEKADVIILLLPPPSTLLLNRYYTSEFFAEVKNRLNQGGIFLCSPGPGDTYFNKESLNLFSSIFNSLAANFKNVMPVVGNKLYYIASDKALSSSFCQLADKRHINNTYVNSDYLDDALVTKKSEELVSLIDLGARENRSGFPVACFQSQSYQFSKTLDEKVPAIVLLLLVFAVPAAAIKRRNMLMYFCASALAGFEIILLLTLQILVGNMYQLTGLIIAGLMTGLAVGSGSNFSHPDTFSLRSKVICLVIFYMIFGLLYNYILELKSFLPSIIIILGSGFLPALLTGQVFRELTIKTEGLIVSPIYSADLAGSAFGFIIISGIAVPLLGIQVAIFLLSVLVFGGILFGIIGNK